MTNQKWEEIILVAPRVVIFEREALTFQGTETDPDKVARIMNNIAGSYLSMRRGAIEDPTFPHKNAEMNTHFKQPIPYAVIRRGDEIYVTERLQGAGETRLHGKLSLGAGGHMNPIPGCPDTNSFSNVLKINLERELEEELNIEGSMKFTPVGLINDDLEKVGRVHIGILTFVDVPEGSEVTVRETEQLKGNWMKLAELKEPEVYRRLESWSQIVVDKIL